MDQSKGWALIGEFFWDLGRHLLELLEQNSEIIFYVNATEIVKVCIHYLFSCAYPPRITL